MSTSDDGTGCGSVILFTVILLLLGSGAGHLVTSVEGLEDFPSVVLVSHVSEDGTGLETEDYLVRTEDVQTTVDRLLRDGEERPDRILACPLVHAQEEGSTFLSYLTPPETGCTSHFASARYVEYARRGQSSLLVSTDTE